MRAPRSTFEVMMPPLALAVSSVLAVAAMTLTPHDGAPVAALFAPSLSRAEILERVAMADAALVRHGAFDSIVVAAADTPGLPDRLRRAGAWIVFDPVAIGGCL